jgi:hypothetical protein
MRGLDWQKGGERFQSKEDEIDYAIEEVKKNLVNSLQRQLLREVGQSILRELRHWFEHTDFANFLMHGSKKGPHGDPKDNQSDCDVGVSKDGNTFTRVIDIRNPSPQCLKDLSKRSNIPEKDIETLFFLYKGMDSEDFNVDRLPLMNLQLAKLAKRAFTNTNWHHEYGGEAWANIVDGWIMLNNAKSYPEKMTAIDHVYDLEHNTGSVLNKHPEYVYMKDVFKQHQPYGDKVPEFPNNLKRVLDHKASVTSPYEMIAYVSPAMKKLALAALRQKTGGSLEDYNAKKSDMEFNTFNAITKKHNERKSQERREQMRSFYQDQLDRMSKMFRRDEDYK